jgi:UDP-N-acetylmuramyl pentapeptide synthase
MCELGELEREAHAELGRQIAKSDWEHLVTVGERGAWIGQAAQSVNSTSIRVRTCAGSDEAAAILRSESSRGDAVLLKASRAVQLESIIDLLLA